MFTFTSAENHSLIKSTYRCQEILLKLYKKSFGVIPLSPEGYCGSLKNYHLLPFTVRLFLPAHWYSGNTKSLCSIILLLTNNTFDVTEMDARRSSKDTSYILYRHPGFLLLPPLKCYIIFFLDQPQAILYHSISGYWWWDDCGSFRLFSGLYWCLGNGTIGTDKGS